MTAKISISLPEDLLAALDEEARATGVSRSELIKEAAGSYLGKTAEERETERRALRKERVLSGFVALQQQPVRDKRPTLEILREIRETDDSARMRCDE